MAHSCRRRLLLLLMSVLTVLCGSVCSRSPAAPGKSVSFQFDFADGIQEWVADFADYPVGQEDFFELASGYEPVPPPIGPARRALFIAGNNHSDDLFMYWKRMLTGFRRGASYRTRMTVEIATDVPRGCGGPGLPGESVYLKAGASAIEPVTSTDASGYRRLTIDKGNQGAGGRNALVLGTIENSIPCEAGTRAWELKTFDSPPAGLPIDADGSGTIWVFVGTDSGFEGVTAIYFTRFSVRFEPF